MLAYQSRRLGMATVCSAPLLHISGLAQPHVRLPYGHLAQLLKVRKYPLRYESRSVNAFHVRLHHLDIIFEVPAVPTAYMMPSA